MPLVFFTLVLMTFCHAGFLKIQLSNFSLDLGNFHSYIMKDSPMFSSSICTVLSFTFRSLTYLEFTPIYSMQMNPFLSFSYSYPVVPTSLFEKSFSTDFRCCLYHGLNFHVQLSLFLDFLFGCINLSVYSLANIIFL